MAAWRPTDAELSVDEDFSTLDGSLATKYQKSKGRKQQMTVLFWMFTMIL